ncbi:MAG TPA: hypothetical protein V6C76_12460 [Drouetiella sp.]
MSTSTPRDDDEEISFQPTSLDSAEADLDASGGIDMSPIRRAFHFKRATDLLPPPTVNSWRTIQTGDRPGAEIVQEWVDDDLTGCVIASNNQHKTRSALLLYRGKGVGCIYTTKTMPLTQPTEEAIKLLVRDLDHPNSVVKVYALPESTVVPMSALFLGYPIFRTDDLDAIGYTDYMCGWLKNRQQSACLAINLPQSCSTCLCLIHQGEFSGAFYVEDQEMIRDQKFVMELLRNEPGAHVEASILPPELTSSDSYGYGLLEK